MRGSSKVRFALVFTGFCRCRTLCAWSVRRIEKLRKNNRLELQNQGSGRPRGAQRSKFERKNGQLARKYTLEVPSGPPKNFKSARTRALRASKSACERPKRGRNPKHARRFSVIWRWILSETSVSLQPFWLKAEEQGCRLGEQNSETHLCLNLAPRDKSRIPKSFR